MTTESMNMTTESMKTMKKNYRNTVWLRNLLFSLYDTLRATYENSDEISQTSLDDFKYQLTEFQQKSSNNGFLIMEIIQLTSWLSNISGSTKTVVINTCEERIEYINNLLACFNSSACEEDDKTSEN